MKLSHKTHLILDLSSHFLSTFVLAALIYLKTGNPSYAGILVLAGIFIDLDHCIDYFLFFKTNFNLRDFLNCSYLKSGRVYIFLHSWEINFIIFIIALSIDSYSLFLLFVGFSSHLVIDNLQRKNVFCYLIIYRFLKKFNLSVIMPERRYLLK